MKQYGIWRILFLVVCVSGMWPGTAAADPVKMTSGQSCYQVTPHAEILMDPGGTLGLRDVRTGKNGAFKPYFRDVVSIGRTSSAVWFRFRLSPSFDAEKRDWVFEVGKQNIGALDLYIPVALAGGEVRYRKVAFGSWRPYPPEHIPARIPVVALPHHWVSGAWFYLRVKSDISMNFPVRVQSATEFISDLLPDLYGFGILFGILLGMALYNFSIFAFLRDRTYLFYVLYIISLFWCITLVYGHFELFFKPPPEDLRRAYFFANGSAWLFGGIFSRKFLNTREHAPLCDRLILASMACCLGVSAVGLSGYNHLAHHLNTIVSMVCPPLAIVASVRVWQKRFYPAKYFFLAWLVMMTGIAVYCMGGIIIPRSPLTVYTFAVGAGLESILLSLALADRIRMLRVEKDRLRQREKQLHHAAVTDGLTGLFNRRFLLESLEDQVRIARNGSEPLSLIIMDVDDFKGFNDAHGHLEGDKVLTALAGVLNSQLRDRDRACRYGGEEFVVVLPDTFLAQALGIAERIRKSFSDVPFRPETDARIHITLSIGAAELAPGEEGCEMLRRADQALYAAKHRGKNRVIPAV